MIAPERSGRSEALAAEMVSPSPGRVNAGVGMFRSCRLQGAADSLLIAEMP
jgi:hypothetical protein